MTTGRHFVLMCEHGYVHSQCRCPNKNKAVLPKKCDDDAHAANPKPDALEAEIASDE